MTDRVHSITLVLWQDMREDDAEALIEACKQFRQVATVVPNVTNPASQVAYARAAMELRKSWWEALDALDKRSQ